MICGNCFNEVTTQGICEHCGFDSQSNEDKYPMALKPGSILNGRYIIGRVLGQGGFGITYIAQDYQTGERLAIKEYLPMSFTRRSNNGMTVQVNSGNYLEDFEFGKTQFLSEAKTLAEFSGSKHIVCVYRYFEENGTVYFAMEYIDGVSLDQHMSINGGKLTTQAANELLMPIMEALEVVHAAGIIHRDISPDNIMVCKDGTSKLIDFGAARYSIGEKSRTLDIVCKAGFSPYEQYAKRGRRGAFTDVYAMAATYYYVITGKVPPESTERIEEDNLIAPSTFGVKISRNTENALLKGLEIYSASRFQTMKDFIAALDVNQNIEKSHVTSSWQTSTTPQYEKQPVQDYHNPTVNPTTLYNEGLTHLKRQEYDQAFSCFFQAANQGLAEAQYKLGECYYYGYGVQKDYNQAVTWYTKAAEQGFDFAQNDLAYCYEKGVGVKQDRKKAFDWYTKAANQGHSNALYNLGCCYFYGYGVQKDYNQAVTWYTKAANQGNASAQNNLGFCYENGYGVEQNNDKALEWYTKAANQGIPDAAENLKRLSSLINSQKTNGENIHIILRISNEDARTGFTKVLSNTQGRSLSCTFPKGIINGNTYVFHGGGGLGKNGGVNGDLLVKCEISDKTTDTSNTNNTSNQFPISSETLHKNKFLNIPNLIGNIIISFSLILCVILSIYSVICALTGTFSSEVKLILLLAPLLVVPALPNIIYKIAKKTSNDRVSKIAIQVHYWEAVALGVIVIIGTFLIIIRSIFNEIDNSLESDLTKVESVIITDNSGSNKQYNNLNISSVTVGDTLLFGTYEQDNNNTNGKEDIEWQVLAEDDGKILVVSKYVLDWQPYNNEDKEITWESCTLREWLNDTFLSNAFNEAEQSAIQLSSVTADKNPGFSTLPGNNTVDKIFLLSIKEAEQYYGSDAERKCVPSDYAIAQGARTSSDDTLEGNTTWWLRTPGDSLDSAAFVWPDGSFLAELVDGSFKNYLGFIVSQNLGVRPAMWILLSSDTNN